MDVKYLNYILAIGKMKNITKAAKELYVSQSSLSQYLARLELELGTPLFIRAKGELTLTPAGKLYMEAAKEVVRIQGKLYQNIKSLDNKGHITVGVTSQFGLRMLTDIIPDYKKEFPEVTIEISELNVPALTKQIKEESIDCAIMALNDTSAFDEGQVMVLKHEEVFFAIPATHCWHIDHPAGTIKEKELMSMFGKENFLLSKKGSTLRHLADRIFETCGAAPSAMCETNSIIATRTMVAREIGVTFIAESCASDRGHVAYHSFEPRIFRYNVLVQRKNWTLNRPEQKLCNMIMQYFTQIR